MSTKKDLFKACKQLGIKTKTTMKKDQLLSLIGERKQPLSVPMEVDPCGISGSSSAPESTETVSVDVIFHLSDIHIRVLERHQEYREVFNNLYGILQGYKNTNPDLVGLIVITGDIFHERNKLVPETLVLFDDFMKKLGDLFQVFMIPGNHDCFSNSGRLDLLSGLDSIKSYPRVKLLRESGYCRYGNIIFGVSSILDGTLIKAPERVENLTSVALYHGPVGVPGSTEAKYMKHCIKPSVFDGYDMVMLGDIHERNFIQPNMAYPGSLIQQTFGEPGAHGIIMWNVAARTGEFIDVPSNYDFFDLRWTPDFDIDSCRFNEHTRLRITIDKEHTEYDFTGLIKQFRDKTDLVSVKKEIIKDKTSNEEMQVDPTSRSDASIEAQVFSELMKNSDSVVAEQDIMKLHAKLATTDEKQAKSAVLWDISRIEFRNVFSYGNDVLNVVDFQDGVTGILAENATGKTSIMNAILYALFGNFYKQTYNNKNLISKYTGKSCLLVRLFISSSVTDARAVNGYIIERSAINKKRANDIRMEETLEFKKMSVNDIGEKVVSSIECGNRADTEKYMQKALGLYSKDEFVLTNMLSNTSYGGGANILSMSNAQLEDVFTSLFDLGKFSKAHEEAKKEFKKITSTRDGLLAQINLLKEKLGPKGNEGLIALQDGLAAKRESLTHTEAEIKTLQESITKVVNVVDLKQELAELGTSNASDELLAREEEIDDELTDVKSTINSSAFNGVIQKKLKQSANAVSIDDLTSQIQDLLTQKHVLSGGNFTNEYFSAKKTLASLKDNTFDIQTLVEILSDLITKDEYCLLPLTVRDSILTDIKTKGIYDPEQVARCQKIISDKEQYDAQVKHNAKIDERVSVLRRDLEAAKSGKLYDLLARRTELTGLLSRIDAHYRSLEIIGILDSTTEHESMETLCKLRKEQLALASAIGGLESDIKEVHRNQEKLEKLSEKMVVVERNYKLYKTYKDLVSDKKVPRQLLKSSLAVVSEYANRMAYNFTGINVSIESINDKWTIVLKRGANALGTEHISAYERFIVNTSLKVALNKYKVFSSVRLFMIDEVIDCVSSENLECIDELLAILETEYAKVIMISHKTDLKDKVAHRILLEKTENGSRVL